MTDAQRKRVLFICMGNICRSPLAEGLFLHKINQRGVADRFRVDSCGTGGWHVGHPPDHRMLEVARDRGVVLPSRARQVRTSDFEEFDLLICMDRENSGDLLELGASPAKVKLLLEYAPDLNEKEVPDPYYGEEDGFEQVFDLVDAATEALLDSLLDGDR